jgi:heme exporter protein A
MNDASPGASGPRAPALRVRGLACHRGDRILFDGFDADVDDGEIVWLRAPNGYGKTSLLRVLAGLAQPAAGSIAWRPDGGVTAYIAHTNAQKDDLTAGESLAFLARLHRLDASDAAVRDALARFGLATRRRAPVRTLSQGQRRRLALARLCLVRGGTWLLDEPYDALDQDATVVLGALLADHRTRGGSAILTSHVEPALADLRPLALDARQDLSTR